MTLLWDIDDCPSINVCGNHGSCIDEINTFRCECDLGFEGDWCEIDIDDCPSPTICGNYFLIVISFHADFGILCASKKVERVAILEVKSRLAQSLIFNFQSPHCRISGIYENFFWVYTGEILKAWKIQIYII